MSRLFLGFGVGFGAIVLGAVVGCSGGATSASSDFGPDPDFASLDQQAQAPTGSLAADGVSRAVQAIDALRAPAVAIGTLAKVSASKTSCDALAHGDAAGTCACPGGGVIDYDFTALADARASGATGAITLRTRLVRCTVGGVTLDGRQFAQAEHDDVQAIDAQIDVGAPGAAPVSLAVWHDGTTWWARTQVSDGQIVVGVADAPTAGQGRLVVVKDRASTWTCALPSDGAARDGNDDHGTAGAAHCTSDAGATRELPQT
jgi:hypothetical protein